jgi:hypothetical protein
MVVVSPRSGWYLRVHWNILWYRSWAAVWACLVEMCVYVVLLFRCVIPHSIYLSHVTATGPSPLSADRITMLLFFGGHQGYIVGRLRDLI